MHEKNEARIFGRVDSMGEHESPVAEFPFGDEASYNELLDEVTEELAIAQGEELPPIEVNLWSLSDEVRAEVLDVESDFDEGLNDIEANASKSKLDLLKEVIARLADKASEAYEVVRPGLEKAYEVAKPGLEFVDLDTPEKAVEALIELIPLVGAGYAISGYRLKIDRDPKTGARTPSFPALTGSQRAIYAAGELVASGHIANGIYKTALKKGFGVTAMKAIQSTLVRGQTMLIKRVHQGIEKFKTEA